MYPIQKLQEDIQLEQWQFEEIRKGLDEADRGEFADQQEVEQVLRKWSRQTEKSRRNS